MVVLMVFEYQPDELGCSVCPRSLPHINFDTANMA